MRFGEPEISGGPYPKDLLGHLLMVWAVDYIQDAPTKFSRGNQPSDAIVVDLVDLDEVDHTGQAGVVSYGAWWRPSKLIQSLKRRLGSEDPVLVWMTLGTASPGMNQPYVLVSATGDPGAMDRAEKWLAANPDFRPSSAGMPQTQGMSNSHPQPEVEGSDNRIRSSLERMARQAQEGADRLPPPPPEPPRGSYPGKVPF